MISRPKTLPGGALVADVRVQFERPSVRTVLLADDGRFVGAIDRDRLPVDASDQEPATRYLDEQPSTVTPDTTVSAAIELLRERSEPRLIVLDPDGGHAAGPAVCQRHRHRVLHPVATTSDYRALGATERLSITQSMNLTAPVAVSSRH